MARLLVALVSAAASGMAAAAQLSLADMRALYGEPAAVPVRPRYRQQQVSAGNVTLRDACAAKGIFCGSAMNYFYLQNASDPLYEPTFAAQYDLATAENACKFSQVEPALGEFNFTECDAVWSMTQAAKGAFRVHNSIWGVDNPSWLTKGGWNGQQLRSILQEHVGNYTAHAAAGGAYCIDVVNEAISDGAAGAPLFKNGTWFPAVPDYVELALRTARAVAGSSPLKLFYNEYGIEGAGPKFDRLMSMVTDFKNRGVPLDGVGLQMHISVGAYPPASQVSANIAQLCAKGLEVHITEMDVACHPKQGEATCGPDELDAQAQIYGDILGACLDNSCCKSFETWGYTDLHTWLWSFNNPQHIDLQPLPFDVNYAPKPAFYEMLSVLQAHPRHS